MKYEEVKGDLIALAKAGAFDVIAHGCNCFCAMKSGIAPQMAKAFACDEYPLEHTSYKGNIDKLGRISYGDTFLLIDPEHPHGDPQKRSQISYRSGDTGKTWGSRGYKLLNIVNCYTQFGYDATVQQLNYAALTLCLLKINHIFRGKHIGLPQIGCGLAGGHWPSVKEIIQGTLRDCNVTVVIYDKN